MIVVADTSPFVALANIGRLDLLPILFGRVLIPPQVLDELQSSKRPGTVRAFVATAPVSADVKARQFAGEKARTEGRTGQPEGLRAPWAATLAPVTP